MSASQDVQASEWPFASFFVYINSSFAFAQLLGVQEFRSSLQAERPKVERQELQTIVLDSAFVPVLDELAYMRHIVRFRGWRRVCFPMETHWAQWLLRHRSRGTVSTRMCPPCRVGDFRRCHSLEKNACRSKFWSNSSVSSTWMSRRVFFIIFWIFSGILFGG